MKNLILATDVDGTILKHNDGHEAPLSIHLYDKERIIKFNQIKENTLIISTGRDISSVLSLFEREKVILDRGYFITSGGAEIYNHKKELIKSHRLANEEILKIKELFLIHNKLEHLEFGIFNGKETFAFSNNNDLRDFNYSDDGINIFVGSKRRKIEDITAFYHEAKELFTSANILQNNWSVDIVPKDISKATAIKDIIDLLEIDTNNTIVAIGDSWNDIPMFEIADISYTFNNSPQDVKEYANCLVDHFYECVDEILLDK